MELSIVVPCYNEGANLANLAEAFRAPLSGQSGIEVVLVNNGSRDDSAAKLNNLLQDGRYPFLRTVHVPVNQGYGYGILSGLAQTRGKFLAWTHADLQTDPADVVRGWQQLRTSQEPQRTVLSGARRGRPLFDRLFSQGFGCFASAMLGTFLWEINAQPKIFPRAFLPLLGAAPYDFSLDLYWQYVAKAQGWEVLTMPVNFGQRHAGEAKGGGSLRGKWKLTLRTVSYVWQLRQELRKNTRPAGEFAQVFQQIASMGNSPANPVASVRAHAA